MITIVRSVSSYYKIAENGACLKTGAIKTTQQPMSMPGNPEGYTLRGVMVNSNTGDIRALNETLFPGDTRQYQYKQGDPKYFQLVWVNKQEDQTLISSTVQTAIRKSENQNTLPSTPISKSRSSDTLPAIQAPVVPDDEV